MHQSYKIDSLPEGTLLGGTYRLKSFLGSGGMGVVYKAEHQRTGRLLAAKILRPTLSSDNKIVERFQREARAAAALGHPNIVEIIDINIDEETGLHYIIMEFLEGNDLSVLLTKQSPFPLEKTIWVAQNLLLAMEAAHSAGIIHRDIKPANIFISKVGDLESVKLLDFGISKFFSGTSITGGIVLGTPLYMAPEQACSSEEIDLRADIFSAGVVIYEMLTSHSPFEAPSIPAVIFKLISVEPEPIEKYRKDIPKEICSAIMQAMSKDPEKRFSSAKEFLLALTSPINGSRDKTELLKQSKYYNLEDEIRLVTILFISLTTTYSTKKEFYQCEIYDKLINATNLIQQKINENGGWVEKILGDSVLAIFGFSKSTGDDAVKAVRTALEIKNIINDSNISLKIGLSTGKVLSTSTYGKKEKLNIIGEAIGIARSAATENIGDEVIIDEDTARHICGRFKIEELIPIKNGEDDTQKLYRVLMEYPHGLIVEQKELFGKTIKLIGRDFELNILKNLYGRCIEESSFQLVLITGAIGVGKSSLVNEFRIYIENSSSDQITFFAGGVPVESRISLGYFSDMLKLKMGIHANDKSSEITEKIELYLRSWKIDPNSEGFHILNALREIFGMSNNNPMEGRDIIQKSEIIGLFFELLTKSLPLLIVLEDLQWADQISLEFLSKIFQMLENKPVFVIGVSRQKSAENIEKIFPDIKPSLLIELQPLTKKSVHYYLENIFNSKDIVSVLENIVAPAEGNPLFIEEILQDLVRKKFIEKFGEKWIISKKLEEIEIPSKIEAVLQSRLDSLSTNEKYLISNASVCGYSFWDSFLSKIGISNFEFTLNKLIKEGIIKQNFTTKFKATKEYSFRNKLIRDTAYDSLGPKEKKRVHGEFANWLIDIVGGSIYSEANKDLEKTITNLYYAYYEDIDPEVAGLIAFHLEKSGKIKESAIANIIAGYDSLYSGNFKEAKSQFGLALNLAQKEKMKDLEKFAIFGMADVFSRNGEWMDAIDLYLDAIGCGVNEILEGKGNINTKVLRSLAIGYSATGEYETALRLVEMAKNSAKKNDMEGRIMSDLEKTTALIYYLAGEFDKAIEHSKRSLQLAQESQYFYNIAVNYHNIGDLYFQKKEYDLARENFYLSNEICKEKELFRKLKNINDAFISLLDILENRGENDLLDNIKDCLSFAKKNRYLWDEMQIKILLAKGLLFLNRREEAKENIDDALNLARKMKSTLYEKLCLNLLEDYNKSE